MKIRIIVSVIAILFGISLASGQTAKYDLLIKLDGTTVKCKVMEIGEKDITYKKLDNLDGPSYKILRSQVEKIHFKNGTTEEITAPPKNGVTGIVYKLENNTATVTEIMDHSPAKVAGILVGDLLTKINSTTLKNEDEKVIDNLLNGAPRTKVTITLKRPGMDQPIVLTLIRMDKDSLNKMIENDRRVKEEKIVREKNKPVSDQKSTEELPMANRPQRFLAGVAVLYNFDIGVRLAYEKIRKVAPSQNSFFNSIATGYGSSIAMYSGFQYYVSPYTTFIDKYYLSFDYITEANTKYATVGILGGPALNLTHGSKDINHVDGSSEDYAASFFTVGVHFSEYAQRYFFKDKNGRGRFLIRTNWDQQFTLSGGYVTSWGITLGF